MVVKLPISVMFGDESVWEEEEKNRVIGNADIYGKSEAVDADNMEATDGGGNDTIDDNDDINNGNDYDDNMEAEMVGSDME